MKITSISQAIRNPDRVNVSVDGKYRFSLDIFQVGELGIRIGKEYTEEELTTLETESQFGKLYARALEYCLMRPHSGREIRDYLWRKTLQKKVRNKKTGEISTREGASKQNAQRVFDRLVEKGYVNDESFARYWVENRNQAKGSSLRKLQNELRIKGVDSTIIDAVLTQSSRNDDDELQKVITKKRARYSDVKKLTQYLMRQGFSYDDIREALSRAD